MPTHPNQIVILEAHQEVEDMAPVQQKCSTLNKKESVLQYFVMKQKRPFIVTWHEDSQLNYTQVWIKCLYLVFTTLKRYYCARWRRGKT